MTNEDWNRLRKCYASALPATDVRFAHHWKAVSVESITWTSMLKVLRFCDVPEDVPKDSAMRPLRSFVKYNDGVAMMYPLSFFGVLVGYAVRAVSAKEMMSMVRFSDTACCTASRFYDENTPDMSFYTPIVLTEGFADAEAVARFYPYSMATMGGALRFPLASVIGRFCKTVFLMMDNDDAGKKAERLIKYRLGMHNTEVRTLEYPTKYNDPADFFLGDPKEIERRLNQVSRNVIC